MFVLDSKLETDTHAVAEDADVMIRLMDDARYPWVLVVPKVQGASELHDLDRRTFEKTMRVARRVGRVMRAVFDASKINTAAIGNLVAQLHVHVVARRIGDDAWPDPIWGRGGPVPLSDIEAEKRIQVLRDGLSLD